VLDWYHDDAYVGLTGRLPAAGDEAGTAVLLATSSQVLLLQPVALEQQVGGGGEWRSVLADERGAATRPG
jgi:hypothetical protein